MSLTLLNYTSHGVRTDAFLTVNLSEGLVSLEQGGTVDITATVNRSRVGIGTPVISFGNLPAGLTGEVIDTVGTGSLRMLYTIRITASGSAAIVNAQSIRVTATAPDGTTGSAFLGVTVLEPPDEPGALFVLSASPSTFNVVQDATAATTISLVRAGPSFTADVALAIDETLPSGVTAEFGTTTLAGGTLSTTLTFTATDVAALGSFTATVRGTSAGVLDSVQVLTVNVIEAGNFAHLAPPYTLPMQENDTPMTFNVNTGLYEGTVFDTSWLTRHWLIDNADTVVTIKNSGGTYTPNQIGTALQDAAARNDNTVIVVDAGVTLTRPTTTSTTGVRLRSKGGTYDAAGWTFVVTKPFYDGDWAPTGSRYPDLRPDPIGADERQFMFSFDNGGASSGEWGVLYRDSDTVFKYGFIGCYFEPNAARSFSAASAALLNLGGGVAGGIEGFILRWCVVDAGFRLNPDTGVARRGARCVAINSRRLAIEHSVLYRNWFNGGENNTFAQVSGARTKIKHCFIEGDSINILVGGGQPGIMPEDFEIQHNYLVKSQTNNAASSAFAWPLLTGYSDGTPGTLFPVSNPNAFRTNKQLIEIKFARRFLIHGNVCDTNFTSNAATGTGIGLQFSGQSGTVSGTEMRDITVANNFVTRCTRPFYISPYYNQNPSLVPAPSNRIAVINNVFMRSRREERDKDSNEDLLGMTSSSGPAGEVDYGPYTVQHNTWVVPPGQPNSDGYFDWRVVPYPSSSGGTFGRYLVTFTKNLLPNRWKNTTGGIRYTTSSRTERDFNGVLAGRSAVSGDVWNIAENGIPSDVLSMTRAATQADFPDQYEPAALWQAMGDNPWGWTSNASNPHDSDFSLTAESPLKGIAADGTDPGVDWTVLQAAIAGVRSYNPEDIVFEDSIGIVVDFV